ncbi:MULTISPECIES: Sec-independent protein translocase subunit TatA/TatB [Chitinophaga]|uniref:Sec-independent protein translocase subunit TatA/TatB n=1 Tax=Chitinophaga TaxID=79328 RepID=UPI001FEB6476|nr:MULTISPECIES: twin-arginine translocase TatA/TatE family subunit [Chitinophaga]
MILQDIGMSELLLIAVVVLLLFGGKKIPELMRGLGKGIREFNDAKNNVRQEIEEGMREKPVQPSAPATTDVPTKEAVDPHHNA